MVYSPQDVYARLLVSDRGYPLWTPEPDMSLPSIYVQEGLKIGDVGVVVPKDGSFDVLFNVCLPESHILHRETGVPDNFTPILLSDRDIAKFPDAERAGRIISTSSVAWVSGTQPPDENCSKHVQPGPLDYNFTLSPLEGAALILPEGAEHFYAKNERLFLDEAAQHAMDWYKYAEQRRGRIISHDALYLITGFYKTRSWSLAAYKQDRPAESMDAASARFRALQVGSGYTWQTTQPVDWRAGPSEQYYGSSRGIPNQTVFIQGLKIAVREGILGTKWVDVKVDSPSVRRHAEPSGSRSSWFSAVSSFFGMTSRNSMGPEANIAEGMSTALIIDSTESRNVLVAGSDDVCARDVMIYRFPQVTKPFHPSDTVNRYLLQKVPSATVAVTYDSQWIALIEKGLLKPEELSQEDRLISCLDSNYLAILSDKGAVYMQSKVIEKDVGSGASSSKHLDSTVKFASVHNEPSSSAPESNLAKLISVSPGQATTEGKKGYFGAKIPALRSILGGMSAGSTIRTSQSRLKTKQSNSYSARTTIPSPLRYPIDTAQHASSSSDEVRFGTSPKAERAPLYRRTGYKSPEHPTRYAMSHTPSMAPSVFGESSGTSSSTLIASSGSSIGSSSPHVRDVRRPSLRDNPAWKGSVSSAAGPVYPHARSTEARMQHQPSSLHMHPLFASTRLHSAPISYDVTCAPSSRTVLDRTTHTTVPAHTLAQPATDPPTPVASRLVLRSDKFPWPIVVGSSMSSPSGTSFYTGSSSRSSRSSHITSLDLLYSLHTTLLKRVTPQEWEALGHGSRAQRKVTRAYERRCTTMGGGWEGGVRRLDWLHGKTRLIGIEVEKDSNGHGTGKLVFGKV